jgi:hypothetical protein
VVIDQKVGSREHLLEQGLVGGLQGGGWLFIRVGRLFRFPIWPQAVGIFFLGLRHAIYITQSHRIERWQGNNGATQGRY